LAYPGFLYSGGFSAVCFVVYPDILEMAKYICHIRIEPNFKLRFLPNPIGAADLVLGTHDKFELP
jgi:hypothetical protein